MSLMEMGADLQSLIDTEIPEGRQNLETSYTNLERVAAYCEANYLQAADKKAAFEETKRYTVQSLASVAYQINTLACSVLQMLDLQTEKIGDMESQVNNIAQIVDIHKEKVARREIGVLTATKMIPRQHKIIQPVQQEKAQRYLRKPIDYSILDDIGHGVKLPKQAGRQLLARTGSTVSGGSSGSSTSVPRFQNEQEQFSGFMVGRGSVSKSSSSKEYRVPVTVASTPTPPVMHPEYMMQNRYSGMAQPGQIPQMYQQQPQRISMPPGPSVVTNYSSVSIASRQNSQPMAYQSVSQMPLPPPQLASVAEYRLSSSTEDHLPPPPSPGAFDMRYSIQHSPPLPPPPMDDQYGRDVIIPEMPQYGTYIGRRDSRNLPEWVPQNFVEKVVAVYDYEAEKPDELSFHENCVIYVLRKNEDGWYEGVCDGVTGLFPGNYVDACL